MDMLTILVLGLVFAAVVLGTLAVAPMFERRVDVAARISTVPAATVTTAQGQRQTLRQDHSASLWAKLIAEVEKRGLSLTDTKGDLLTEQLMLAGYNQPYALRAFVLLRTVLTLGLPLLLFLLITVSGVALSPMMTYGSLVLAAVVGLYLPNFIVGSRAAARKQAILNGFPDTLDLMLVCVEAGLGIDACFNRVGQEIITVHPMLSDLFAGVSLELRAGRPRAEALRNMAKKSGLAEINSFTTLIVQSDKLGASIGQALKIYAAEMREARRMRAEEKAHRLPVLLSVPLVCCLLPTMLGVLMLPAAITLRDTLSADSSE
jgi:tight adherence protein C